ncbi:hypothetical protein SAMN05421738_10774 [Algoriella xinjiangensis]|uniref:Uncharacterized protein n=1 Tax=Algoriella xinjiangensis TaxID=684065 RepID=A0A1I4WKV4_9FLAO|nr:MULTISPECIES: hypothetical protein [Algoriella]MBO6212671.1 hypothetical protein [Algoriella sp.]SFN14431.1 hypothetical protein SAMN05421738_10774 [Algoriella xinjiangensis]VDH16812.1 Uncharacterised protein [Algoriella xinjiangensis]
MKKIILLTITLTTFFACQSGNNKEQNLEQIDKKSAREVVLSTKTVGDSVLHITNQKIWANDLLIGEKVDTLITHKQFSPSDSTSTPIYVTIQ